MSNNKKDSDNMYDQQKSKLSAGSAAFMRHIRLSFPMSALGTSRQLYEPIEIHYIL